MVGVCARKFVLTPLFSRITNTLQQQQQQQRILSTTSAQLVPRKKWEWRSSRLPTDTTLSQQYNIVETRPAFGGGVKYAAKTLATSKFKLHSLGIEAECRILDVVHTGTCGPPMHAEVAPKIIRRGYLLEIDGTPLQEAAGGTLEAEHLLQGSSYDVDADVDECVARLRDMFTGGRLYAQVGTSPGNTGCADGRVVEGEHLIRGLKGESVPAPREGLKWRDIGENDAKRLSVPYKWTRKKQRFYTGQMLYFARRKRNQGPKPKTRFRNPWHPYARRATFKYC